MERELIKISVRELVEFILRTGDIDNRIGGKKDAEVCLPVPESIEKFKRAWDRIIMRK